MTLTLKPLTLILLLIYTPLLLADDEDEDDESHLPEVTVVEAVDLQADGTAARRERQVIMVMVSQEYCPFCEDIKRDVVRPMLRGEDFKGHLMIRELSIDPGVEVKDFTGAIRRGVDLAADYSADLTPTLLFLGHDGRELSKKIIGYTTPDLFYYYVEEAINNALVGLKPAVKSSQQ